MRSSTAILIGTKSVTFGTLTVSPTVSTVVVNPSVAPLGGSGAQVTVTLLTAGGSPVEGKTIALTYAGNTGNTVTVQAPTSANGADTFITNSSGVALFQVLDTAPETITLTATDQTDTLPLTPATAPTITFEASAPSATQSTVGVGSSTSVASPRSSHSSPNGYPRLAGSSR